MAMNMLTSTAGLPMFMLTTATDMIMTPLRASTTTHPTMPLARSMRIASMKLIVPPRVKSAMMMLAAIPKMTAVQQRWPAATPMTNTATCIIAAAAIECEKACEIEGEIPDAHLVHRHNHDASGRHPATACGDHLAQAFDQYTAYLESARCICRSVLERGWGSTCCSAQPKKKPIRKRTPGGATSFTSAHAHHPSHHHHGLKRRNKKQLVRVASDKDSCCGDVGDGDSCCGGDHADHAHDEKLSANTRIVNFRDLEKADGLEHLALHVEGMTCSGCGNKMDKSLRTIPGVSNVRVNFVMGQAECSIDTSMMGPDEVIKTAERATGFKCTKLSSDDQAIDILAAGSVAKGLLDLDIPGVTDASLLNKKTVRINYDPTIVGARELYSRLPSGIEGLAPPRDDPSVSSGRKRLYDQLIKTLLAAAFTIPVLVMAWGDDVVQEPTKAIISLCLATVVQMIAIPDFYRPALSSLIYNGVVEMDMLVVISITAAYVYSVVAFGFRMVGQPLETAEFFETSTLLITLVILGRLVAAFARVRAVQAVSLRSLQASSAVVVENGQDKDIDARLLQYGDKFKVAPHTAVPTDGIVITGSSDVDESMLTGESVPVFKKEGDEVIAGTVNGTGTIVARLARLPGKNTVTDIAQLVEDAANSKPPMQDAADRVASWFVPIVTTISILVIIVWVVVGLKIRKYSGGQTVSNAITYAVATLAVSCPCALGLAVPMVLVVAGGVAARSGVIIKSAECTERARKVTDVVFDKTGTITETDLDVMTTEFFDCEENSAIAMTKPLVGNNHPVSLGVAKYLKNRPGSATVTDIHVIPGSGVEGVFEGDVIRAGNPKWTGTDSDPIVKNLQSQGLTLLVITRNSKPIAAYGLRTRLREESTKVIQKLTRRGITVHIVSGDLQQAVESVASQVGIANVAAQRTPSEKRDYVAALMEQGKNVMFVGDGTNDAVAVTQADVGVQIASALSASEVTRGAADVVLLKGLEGIPFVIEISRVSFRRMVFNFVWSAVYNVLAILLASGALVKVRIEPAYAGLGEIVSVLPVIFAASTMLMAKIKTD
ncbi:cation transport ATPase [Cordyceps fumosorosea ARSEF 2679]|uniref:Cation transport ATPase n=1 Tax=Cordyceps fumosorosea (strain ARSEF 2679) TaxID=1081104 RepID=A0A167HJF7_CORFA|nr:cation transport ATPase [Cordyceps fumosorosea ARSEF 2679]OAA47983.1 cation transport ATPase [Cordyceps fumosorosea ARSEF 2679]